MKRAALATALLTAVALLVAGCGGGSGSSAGSTTKVPAGVNPGGPEKPATGGGATKEATAPNVPAGSKVTSCPGAGPGVRGLRAVALDCGAARTQMKRWEGKSGCALAGGASRSSCSLGRWRCQAIRADRGTVVSCARPDGGDVSFIEKG